MNILDDYLPHDHRTGRPIFVIETDAAGGVDGATRPASVAIALNGSHRCVLAAKRDREERRAER